MDSLQNETDYFSTSVVVVILGILPLYKVQTFCSLKSFELQYDTYQDSHDRICAY